MGIYPHLNIIDAAFVVVRDGVETALHASRWLGMERMDTTVGPISIEVLEPLQKLKLKVDAPDKGIKAEIVFEGRAFPIEEPRFIRRNGPRTMMDYTRLTQNGRYTGGLEVDGKRESVDGFVGTRDRSWGIRPVGARDAQEAALCRSPASSSGSGRHATSKLARFLPHQRRRDWHALEPSRPSGRGTTPTPTPSTKASAAASTSNGRAARVTPRAPSCG